jgi:hypothetical protein
MAEVRDAETVTSHNLRAVEHRIRLRFAVGAPEGQDGETAARE